MFRITLLVAVLFFLFTGCSKDDKDEDLHNKSKQQLWGSVRTFDGTARYRDRWANGQNNDSSYQVAGYKLFFEHAADDYINIYDDDHIFDSIYPLNAFIAEGKTPPCNECVVYLGSYHGKQGDYRIDFIHNTNTNKITDLTFSVHDASGEYDPAGAYTHHPSISYDFQLNEE